jgi:hypothetical protein
VSDPNDNSIPVLREILVPGRAPQTHDASDGAATPAAQPAAESAAPATTPREPDVRKEPVPAPTPQAAPQAEHPAPPVSFPVPAPGAELHPPHVADHTHAKKSPRPHHGIHTHHGHDDVHEEMEVSPGVFDRDEPGVPAEAGATVPPDLGYEAAHDAAHEAASSHHLDAEVIAERLRGRFASFLAGDGRGIIEARCRDALQQHTSLLVGQITGEVVRTLEAEITGWVREAVEEEIARRSGRA